MAATAVGPNFERVMFPFTHHHQDQIGVKIGGGQRSFHQDSEAPYMLPNEYVFSLSTSADAIELKHDVAPRNMPVSNDNAESCPRS